MKTWIAFWNIMVKDVKTYYTKPPNLSWGLIFPLAWTGMFFIRSGGGIEGIAALLPGVVALSILFGATSLLAVTVTFEKKNGSFERLMLSPVPFEALMLSKTAGAILFGIANGFVPVVLALPFADLSRVAWGVFLPAVALISVASSFIGFFVAVSVKEIFEAQTLSNFFRFPMIFLCGLFFPVASLPAFLRPVSYALPLTYGADALHAAVDGKNALPVALDMLLLGAFCAALFAATLWNIRRKWIL